MTENKVKVSSSNIGSIGNNGTIINSTGEVQGNQIGSQYNYTLKYNLDEIKAEIQKLLDELCQTFPTQTPDEQKVVADKAIEKINKDSTLKKRIIAAFKAGTVETFKELIDNPVYNILCSAFEAWREGE